MVVNVNEDEGYEAGENGRLLKPVSCLLLLLTIPLNSTRPHVTHDGNEEDDGADADDVYCVSSTLLYPVSLLIGC